MREGFQTTIPSCNVCKKPAPLCACPEQCDKKADGGKNADGGKKKNDKKKTCNKVNQFVCPPCAQPDMSKYVLKATVPPCRPPPDLSQYMLKTQCPPVPDLSKYVLKSSIPKQQPVIIDTSACKKDSGECPPCPRARCPEVKCPPPQSCPPPAPCPRAVCPPTTVKCKAESNHDSTVRPYLAPLNMSVFGE